MAGRTGYTLPTRQMIPDGPAQDKAVLEHFDPLIGESRTTAAQLPASGNWSGRTIWVEAEDVLYVWDGSWGAVGGRAQSLSATPNSGAVLDGPDPLKMWWDGVTADLRGTIRVNSGTWQVGWQVCATLPADNGATRIRPRQQAFMLGRSGSALVQVKVTAAGLTTLDAVLSGSTAEWLLLFGNRWATRG